MSRRNVDFRAVQESTFSLIVFQDTKQNICSKPASENVESLEYVEYILYFDRTCENMD